MSARHKATMVVVMKALLLASVVLNLACGVMAIERARIKQSRTADTADAIHLPDEIRAPDKGALLSQMEWHIGSDDPSAELNSVANVFTPKDPEPNRQQVELKNPTEVLSENQLQQVQRSVQQRAVSADDLFGAQLVRAYSKVNDPTDQGSNDTVRAYRTFLKKNPVYVEDLKRLFTALDANNDGGIDRAELLAAKISQALDDDAIRAVMTWDLNNSERVSWQEFRMGPLFHAVLEDTQNLLASFKANAPGNDAACKQTFRSMLDAYERRNPAALGFLEVASWETSQIEENREAPGRMRPLARESLVEAGAQTDAALQADARAQALASVGRGQFIGAITKFMGFGKSDNAKDAGAKRPKSQFGIPSYMDERCVICQYVMQQVDAELEKKAVDDYTAFDDTPRAREPLANPYASVNTQRRPSLELIDKRGERTPTRIIKAVVERVMRKHCGDLAPAVFKAACRAIWSKRKTLSNNILRKQAAGNNCDLSGLCGAGGYFMTEAAVHSPTMSYKFNSLRGPCGLTGGSYDRVEGMARWKCMLQAAAMGIGILK